jgi:SAM-dependent methyltransferase
MIPKWRAKALVQRAISYLPYKERINYLFQRYVTKGIVLNDEHFGLKLSHARDHVAFFRKYGTGFGQQAVLELGTGWYPIIPLSMYLAGMERIYTIDIFLWMTKESRLTAMSKFVEWADSGKLEAFIPDYNRERLEQLRSMVKNPGQYSVEGIDKILNLRYIIQDARATSFETGYFDYICSNNTCGNIYYPILRDIFKEFKRLLKPGAVMCHFLDLSDNFSNMDDSINIYNFLQYTDAEWARLDSPIISQNRMRFPDYENMFEEVGLPITESSVRPGDIALLKSMKLAPAFTKYPIEQVAISHAYVVSKI